MIPEPLVRTSRTWRFTYQRPAADGWPLIRIASVVNNTGYKLAPHAITVTVIGGVHARTIRWVTVSGNWVDGGQTTVQQLDLPNARRGHTPAPDWVIEITRDALERTVAESGPRGDSGRR